MATTFNLSPTEKQGVLDFIVGNLNNPEVITNAAKRYGATANDLASITGLPVDQVNLYFSQAGITLPTFSDQYGFQEDSSTVVKTAEQQRQEYIKEQERLASLTPAQQAIEKAKYTESLEGGNETKYNPVTFQGREWLVGPSGNNLVALSNDQSGLSGNFKRYDILDPTTGQVTQQVSEDRTMWQRFVKDLPKIALGAAAVIGGPALLKAAGGLFEGAGAASSTAAGATAAGAVGTEAALTGTGLLGASEAAFVAADAAQLAAQGLSTSQITSTLAATGIPTTTASTLAQAATAAFGEAIASGVPANIAAMSAEVAAGNAAAGLSITDAVAAGKAVGTDAAALGAAGAAGNIIGGGGAITAGTTGALTGANALTGTVAGSTVASTDAKAAPSLLSGGGANLLGGLLSSGVNLAMVNDAADKLRKQGQISQAEYNTIATNLAGLYRDVGFEAKTGLQDVASKASGMIGNFTPYGVSNQLFGTKVSPTGQLETTMTPTGLELYAPFARVAGQSALAAENMNIDTLASDYYKKLAALSAPEVERQRLATEARLRAQGRLGVSGSAFGGSSPELLAQEQAIARQQLERELQSRQAALGERGALITQGTTAYSPISNLLGLQAQQQQLSGQLGQAATQADIARANAYMQPATAAITAPLSLYGQGLQQVGQTQRLGTASNLAAQQAALDALAVGRSNVANQLLGQNGSNIGSLINNAAGLFNQSSGRELYDLFNVGGLSPDTLATLQQTGNAGLQDIIGNTGNLLSIGLGG